VQVRIDKQVAYHACGALFVYFKAHLVCHVGALRARLAAAEGGAAGQVGSPGHYSFGGGSFRGRCYGPPSECQAG
jgi:hypothetical protein